MVNSSIPIKDNVSVWIFNSRQENVPLCVKGPSEEFVNEHGTENVGNPWHGVGKARTFLPADLNEGDVVLFRRTTLKRDGTQGTEPSGVHGIWRYHDHKRNPKNLPWPEEYRWVIYCRPVERELEETLTENFEALPIAGQSLENSIRKLTSFEGKGYIDYVSKYGMLHDETREFLESVSNKL